MVQILSAILCVSMVFAAGAPSVLAAPGLTSVHPLSTTHHPLLPTFHPDRARQSQAQITTIINILNQMTTDAIGISNQAGTIQTTLQGNESKALTAALTKINSDVTELESTLAETRSTVQKAGST
jgi:hypothetical protein